MPKAIPVVTSPSTVSLEYDEEIPRPTLELGRVYVERRRGKPVFVKKKAPHLPLKSVFRGINPASRYTLARVVEDPHPPARIRRGSTIRVVKDSAPPLRVVSTSSTSPVRVVSASKPTIEVIREPSPVRVVNASTPVAIVDSSPPVAIVNETTPPIAVVSQEAPVKVVSAAPTVKVYDPTPKSPVRIVSDSTSAIRVASHGSKSSAPIIQVYNTPPKPKSASCCSSHSHGHSHSHSCGHAHHSHTHSHGHSHGHGHAHAHDQDHSHCVHRSSCPVHTTHPSQTANITLYPVPGGYVPVQTTPAAPATVVSNPPLSKETPPVPLVVPPIPSIVPTVTSVVPSKALGKIHSCAGCGKYRSSSFHSKNPFLPGQIPTPAFCARCKKDHTSSSSTGSATLIAKAHRRRRHTESNRRERQKSRRPSQRYDYDDDDDEWDAQSLRSSQIYLSPRGGYISPPRECRPQRAEYGSPARMHTYIPPRTFRHVPAREVRSAQGSHMYVPEATQDYIEVHESPSPQRIRRYVPESEPSSPRYSKPSLSPRYVRETTIINNYASDTGRRIPEPICTSSPSSPHERDYEFVERTAKTFVPRHYESLPRDRPIQRPTRSARVFRVNQSYTDTEDDVFFESDTPHVHFHEPRSEDLHSPPPRGRTRIKTYRRPDHDGYVEETYPATRVRQEVVLPTAPVAPTTRYLDERQQCPRPEFTFMRERTRPREHITVHRHTRSSPQYETVHRRTRSRSRERIYYSPERRGYRD